MRKIIEKARELIMNQYQDIRTSVIDAVEVIRELIDLIFETLKDYAISFFYVFNKVKSIVRKMKYKRLYKRQKIP